jgi:FkbM family methyltransferase
MVADFFRNFYYTERAKGGLEKRIRVLYTLNKLVFKKYLFHRKKNDLVSEEVGGSEITAYSYQSLYFLYSEIFCSKDYYFKTDSRNPIIIDCGANIGVATIYFKRLYPDSRILSFEANPNTYALLQRNIDKNKLTNVEMHNIALFDTDTNVSFFISNDLGTLVGSLLPGRGGDTEINIKAEKLSSYMKQLPVIDLVKIDVEGAEINIINDLLQSGELSKPEQYIIEYHHNMAGENSSLSSFLKKFETAGYNYSVKANFSKIKAFQDILIHCYKR